MYVRQERLEPDQNSLDRVQNQFGRREGQGINVQVQLVAVDRINCMY